jgi:hypothetical protein
MARITCTSKGTTSTSTARTRTASTTCRSAAHTVTSMGRTRTASTTSTEGDGTDTSTARQRVFRGFRRPNRWSTSPQRPRVLSLFCRSSRYYWSGTSPLGDRAAGGRRPHPHGCCRHRPPYPSYHRSPMRRTETFQGRILTDDELDTLIQTTDALVLSIRGLIHLEAFLTLR